MKPQDMLTNVNHIIPTSIWVGAAIAIIFFSAIAVLIFKRKDPNHSSFYAWNRALIKVTVKPFLCFGFFYLASLTLAFIAFYFPNLLHNQVNLSIKIMSYLLSLAEGITFFWIVFNALNLGQHRLQAWFIRTNKKVLAILLPMISNSLKTAIIFVMLNILIPHVGVSGLAEEVLKKGAKVFLIGTLAWLAFQLINGSELLILTQYNFDRSYDPRARSIRTQVQLLKKVLFTLLFVVTIACVLMIFDSVRNIGTGILTTAGIISAAGAFASQQSLSRIFSGIQLAFTQPIRLGDTIIVENEQGEIEEITLSYIVVKLWDLRRLILPSDYFTSHTVQNLTRNSTELLGTVYFYVDYTAPVDELRRKFNDILANSKKWNGKVSSFVVTDVKETSMQLRAVVSGDDSGTLWELRCEVREKLMKFIADNYPQALCRARQTNITTTKQFDRSSV